MQFTNTHHPLSATLTLVMTCCVLVSVGCGKQRSANATEVRAPIAVTPPLSALNDKDKDKDQDKKKKSEDQTEATLVASTDIADVAALIKEPDAKKPEFVEPPSYEAQLFEGDGISLRRLAMAPEIEAREPVAVLSQFKAGGGRVYAFVDAINETDEAQDLTVNFIGPEGQVRGGIVVSVPAKSPRWRTWAYSETMRAAGEWTTEIRTADNALLGSLRFDVDKDE